MATSYSNTGGQGNRTSIITVTFNWTPPDGTASNLVDGGTSNNSADSTDFAGGHLTGNIIRFDFTNSGFHQIIDEITFTQQLSVAEGTWKIRANNDGGASWTDLLTGEVWGAIQSKVFTFTNSTGYIFYEMVQTSGNVSTSPWLQEVTFKIEQGTAITSGVDGTLAVTEAPDVVAMTASIVGTGTLAVTEAADVVSFNALIIASGTLAVTEDSDQAAFTNIVANPETSYSNQFGSGDRTADVVTTSSSGLFSTGTLADLIDGSLVANNRFNVVTNGWMKFDFGAGQHKVIDEFEWRQSGPTTANDGAGHGTWQWSISDDDATYTPIGSSFILYGIVYGPSNPGTIAQRIPQPAENVLGARYWQLVQLAGHTDSLSPFSEINFKIANVITHAALAVTEASDVASFAARTYNTSYANPGGTGNRNSLINVSTTATLLSGTIDNLVDGVVASNTAADAVILTGGQSGVRIEFDFSPTGHTQIIDAFEWWEQFTQNNGTWRFEGFNGTTWDIITTGIALGTISSTHEWSFPNANDYEKYALQQTAGTTSASEGWSQEIKFKLVEFALIMPRGTLVVTEGSDVASFQVTFPGTLFVTESPDIAEFHMRIPTQGPLAVTEAPDTVLMIDYTSATLAVTEAPDIVVFFDHNFGTFVTTELSDVASFVGAYAKHPEVITIVSNT